MAGWFYRIEGMMEDTIEGPVTPEQLMQLAFDGKLKLKTPVMSDAATKGQWVYLERITQLKQKVAEGEVHREREAEAKKERAKQEAEEKRRQKEEEKRQRALVVAEQKRAAEVYRQQDLLDRQQAATTTPQYVLVNTAPAVEPRLKAGGWFTRAFSTTAGIILCVTMFAVGLPVLVCGGCLVVGGLATAVNNSSPPIAQTPSVSGRSAQRESTSDLASTPVSSGNLPPAIAWHGLNEPIKSGDLEIVLQSASVGKINLTSLGDNATSKDDLLIVWFEITNRSTTKKIDFMGWQESASFLSSDISLEDDIKNRYRRSQFGFGTDIADSENAESLYPGKSVRHAIVFEPPVDSYEYLRLILPGRNVGSSEPLRFQLNKQAIK